MASLLNAVRPKNLSANCHQSSTLKSGVVGDIAVTLCGSKRWPRPLGEALGSDETHGMKHERYIFVKE